MTVQEQRLHSAKPMPPILLPISEEYIANFFQTYSSYFKSQLGQLLVEQVQYCYRVDQTPAVVVKNLHLPFWLQLKKHSHPTCPVTVSKKQNSLTSSLHTWCYLWFLIAFIDTIEREHQSWVRYISLGDCPALRAIQEDG